MFNNLSVREISVLVGSAIAIAVTSSVTTAAIIKRRTLKAKAKQSAYNAAETVQEKAETVKEKTKDAK